MHVKLFFLALFLGLFPIFIIKWGAKENNKDAGFIKPFAYLVFSASIYEYFSYRMEFLSGYGFRVYSICEFLTIFYYFFYLLKKKYKLLFYFFGTVYILLFCYLLIIWKIEDSMKTDSYLTIVEILFVYCCTFLWFKNIFADMSEISLLSLGHFYIVSGFIIYFSGTFFLFLLGDYILKNMESEFTAYWNLTIWFNIILRTLLIIGVWKISRKLVR